MAKYQDYIQKEDELEDEIQQAGYAQQTREGQSDEGFQMPDRFRNKSAEEIARSYAELERLNSRQAQDLGTMRRTVDEFLSLKSGDSNTQTPQPQAPAPVTVDDLYDNPDETISRKVEQVAGDRISRLEQELEQARLQTRVQALTEKYPEWQDTVKDPQFVEWVKASPYRLRVAQAADAWDLDAAEELLALHTEVKGVRNAQTQAQRDRQLANASLESGAASVPAAEQTFSRADLMDKRIRAAHGDTEAIKYMTANREAIAIAYEEGNITD